MRRADIISDIESLAGVTSKYRSLLGRALQQEGIARYATTHPWPHYRDLDYITTIAEYTTGTVTVTQDSKTVTGSGTTFTVAMVGRKLRVASDTAFYEIAAFVSTTEITLAVPYQGSSAAGETFSIFQDEYRLRADVFKPLSLRQLEDGTVMIGLGYADMDLINPDLRNFGDPIWFSIVGRRADTYETGTVAVTSGTKTLTGSSTAWTGVDGLTRGSRIAIVDTSEVFTVKSVDSDTSITTYEAPTTTDASSTYVAYINNIVVQVSDVPDAARSLYYRYHRIPAPLVNDYDEPDMPNEHHHHLWWAGSSVLNSLLGKSSVAKDQEEKFLRLIEEQWQQLAKTAPNLLQVKESMDTVSNIGILRWPSEVGRPLGF